MLNEKNVSYNLRDANESMRFQYECVSENIRKDALAYQGVQRGYCFDKRNKDKKRVLELAAANHGC